MTLAISFADMPRRATPPVRLTLARSPLHRRIEFHFADYFSLGFSAAYRLPIAGFSMPTVTRAHRRHAASFVSRHEGRRIDFALIRIHSIYYWLPSGQQCHIVLLLQRFQKFLMIGYVSGISA